MLEQDVLGILTDLRRHTPHVGWLGIELHGTARHFESPVLRVRVIDQIAVGDYLRILPNLGRRLHWRVNRVELQQALDPMGARPSGEVLAENLAEIEPNLLVDPFYQ